MSNGLVRIFSPLLILSRLTVATPAFSQTPAEESNRWEFTVAPYLVFPHMNGMANRDVSSTNTWFDPLIVARFTAPLESRWHLGISGDIGGFGLGSDFAWQVFPFVGYRFGRVFELGVGYRAIGMKYETGSGEDLFLYGMIIFGPQIALLFHF